MKNEADKQEGIIEEATGAAQAAVGDVIPPETPVRRRLAARRLLRAELYYVASLAGFAALAGLARMHPYFEWDLRAAKAIQSVPGIFEFMRVVSIPGDGWIPHAIAAATVLFFLLIRRNSEAAALALSTGVSAILSRSFKILIARPRPAADLVEVFRPITSKSFPSGHVTFYVCYFGFLFFVAYAVLPRGSMRRRVALVLTGLPVLLVGLSRVYLGEHWPSDTLGAYLMSGAWLAVCLELYRRWKRPKTVISIEQ